MSTTPISIPLPARLGRSEVAPLLAALRDPHPDASAAALHNLVRLPLREWVWFDISRFIWRALAAPAQAAVPRDELIQAAAWLPFVEDRRRLRRLIESSSPTDRRAAAHALARAGDDIAAPQLVADLAEPDVDVRLRAAESLAYVGSGHAREQVLRLCLHDRAVEVRLWLALALIKDGDPTGLHQLLLDIDTGAIDFPGEPALLYERVADHRPYPQAMVELLQAMTANAQLGDRARGVAQALLRACGTHEPAVVRPALIQMPDAVHGQHAIEPLQTVVDDAAAIAAGDGSAIKDLAPATDATQPAPAAPRWLQGQVYELRGDGAPVRAERALRAGGLHRLVVRIGLADKEWLTAPADQPFDASQLPAGEETVELQVAFWEPMHVPSPLKNMIFLPRLAGNSTACEFNFQVRANAPAASLATTSFAGRIAVLYGNRILQTMQLAAQVVPDPAMAPADAAIALLPFTPVRAELAGLSALQPFDAALVAEDGGSGSLHLTTVAGAQVDLYALDDIETVIRYIRQQLKQIAMLPDDYQALDSEATVGLLRFLASQGSLLYENIIVNQLGDHPLRNARRIQLVTTRQTLLPLEFMYERTPPSDDAVLCPKAKQALQTGECASCANLTEEQAEQVICPLGFWCLSRVIERHAIEPLAQSNLNGADYALRSDPVEQRSSLEILSGAVYAASDRVDAGQVQDLQAALADATSQHAVYAPDWAAWRQAVSARNPSMLVLLPHTLESPNRIRILEIGANKQLAELKIKSDIVCAPQAPHAPLVLLLGCETAVPDIAFENFAIKFRASGASIVLTTLAPVLGRHVVPAARVLVDELKRAAHAQGTFGEALLTMRRRALLDGLPVVLGLVGYGDADWRLREETG